MMKAALFHEYGGPEVLRIEDVPIPEPGPGEARVRVCAAALNHLDLWVRRGLPIETPMPHIGGSDIAGEVDAIGPETEGPSLGTRVVADPSLGYGWYSKASGTDGESFRLIGEHTQGGFAEYVTVPVENLMEVPPEVDLDVAAASALASVTAWHGLVERGGLRAGERVLVTGASGGVSTMAIQIARWIGAEVFAVTSGADNLDRVRELGATRVYDRLEVDFSKEIWADTGKEGVDLILDSVGESMWRRNLRSLGVMGRLVTYGATTGPIVESDVRLIFWKQLSILGSTMGSPDDFRRVMSLVFQGEIAPVIHAVMPLDSAREAHEMLESGEVFGKIVLIP